MIRFWNSWYGGNGDLCADEMRRWWGRCSASRTVLRLASRGVDGFAAGIASLFDPFERIQNQDVAVPRSDSPILSISEQHFLFFEKKKLSANRSWFQIWKKRGASFINRGRFSRSCKWTRKLLFVARGLVWGSKIQALAAWDKGEQQLVIVPKSRALWRLSKKGGQ